VFAVSMNLGAAQALWERSPGDARKKLDAAAGLARQAQGELTNLIQTLRPVQVEAKGLTQALREQTQSWEKQSGIGVIFQARGEGAGLAAPVQQALFRFAQEALANVQKHSGATAANVALNLGENEILLEISDNGHGFNVEAPHRGLGLLSMRERIQAMSGQFELRSTAQGTCLSARVPLQKPGLEKGPHPLKGEAE
jgi:two-component system, NarL family, sensor histidine kinase LiaS